MTVCKNAYYVVNKEKMNKPKPMTNEEWFCSLPTEEKAKWLQEHMDCNKDLCYKGYDCCELAFLEWLTFLEWLKQPHTANVHVDFISRFRETREANEH